MKIFIFFLFLFNLLQGENLSKIDLDQSAVDYSKQEKKPEEIEVLDNSDLLQQELQSQLSEIQENYHQDEPIALAPEVVNSLLHNLNYLRKQKQFPEILQDENFEKDKKNPKNSDKALKIKVYEDKIKQQKVQLLSFREKIKELIASIDRIKRSQKRGDQQELHQINQQLEEYELKYAELQHKLFDKDGQPTDDEDPYTELVQHIDIIQAKIKQLSDKLSDMESKDFSDKDLMDIKQLIYEYQLILKDLLQQRVDYLKMKQLQEERLQREIEINELNKEKASTKDEYLKNQIEDRQKDLRKDEEDLDKKERMEQEKLDLEKEMEILHEKERIPATEDEHQKIREQEQRLKEQLKTVDNKLLGTHAINKIYLKYKLDTKMNPMFHNLDNVLDEKFKSTKDLFDGVYNSEISVTSYRDLFRVHDLFIKLQFKLENLFRGFLTTVDQIPKNQEEDLEANLTVINELSTVIFRMKNGFQQIEELYERIETAFENFDPHKVNWVNFYDQLEFQELTINKAKAHRVNHLDISFNEQEVEQFEQVSISDIEKISVCITDIGLLLKDMEDIKSKFILMVPPELLDESKEKPVISDPVLTKKAFEYAKGFINIRIDLEENLNQIKVGLLALQGRKDEMFDKIQELNDMAVEEKEVPEAKQRVDILDTSTYMSGKSIGIFCVTLLFF